MKVCIGSINPSKISGVTRAFGALLGDVEIVPVRTHTGIPPQPMGMSTIIEGAKRRAIEASGKAGMCDVSVGVEAGLYTVESRFFDVQVVYVITASGSESFGFSPSFMVPDVFARALVYGEAEELEEVANKVFSTSDIGNKGGLIKLLTKSLVTREDLTYYATLMALVPLINKELYFPQQEGLQGC